MRIQARKKSILKCQTLNAYLTGCQRAWENNFGIGSMQQNSVAQFNVCTVAAVDDKKYVTKCLQKI